MRHLKILVLALSTLALCFGAAVAGMNPNDFGLAGGTATYNSGKSRICVECHTRIPSNLASNGTHFVTSGDDTRTGGGWTGSRAGVRNGGEYFRLNQWPVGGTYSKYGGTGTDNNSYYTAATDNQAGLVRSDATLANYVTREIICESCHNVVLNVAGGNNLVAPMSGAYVANTGTVTQSIPAANSDEATLCVGCHGFMYTTNATNQPRYGDTRGNIDGTTTKRDNNHVHYINGTLYNQNHHVMTADTITQAIAAVGLYWADTLIKDVSPSGWPAGSQVVSTTPVANSRGTMPMLATWNTDGGKVKSTNAAQINCIHCHSAPHTGDASAGASILRDTNSISTTGAAANAIEKIGQGVRGWMTINDVNYCNDCHTLATR